MLTQKATLDWNKLEPQTLLNAKVSIENSNENNQVPTDKPFRIVRLEL